MRKPVHKRIEERDGQFCVLSETTGRSFGCYSTQAQARRRLSQIERFKTALKAECEACGADHEAATQAFMRGMDEAPMRAPSLSLGAWGLRRARKFLKLWHKGRHDLVYIHDDDLLPESHPLKKNLDPWAALEQQQAQLNAKLAQSIEALDRPTCRGLDDTELQQVHERLSKLYSAQFEGHDRPESATGLLRQSVIKAAAHVTEEYARRGKLEKGQHPFSGEVSALRASGLEQRSPFTLALCGDQCTTVLDLAEFGCWQLLEYARPLAKASHFSPHGSRFFAPLTHPVRCTLAPEESALPAGGSVLAHGRVEKGAETEAGVELFLSGPSLTGRLWLDEASVRLDTDPLPYVLSQAAIDADWMPPDGESALPASLMQDIPPELRFWKAAPGQDARAIRDVLVKHGITDGDHVQVVNREIRRVVQKIFLPARIDVAPDVFAVVPDLPEPLTQGIQLVLPDWQPEAKPLPHVDSDRGITILDIRNGDEAEDVLSKVTTPEYLLIAKHDQLTPSVLAAGCVFRLPQRDSDLWFVSSKPVGGAVEHAPAELAPSTLETMLQKRVSVLKSDDGEERYVLGVVLEPDVVDAQGDIYNAEEVRKACHRFMEDYRNLGLQHKALINDKVKLLENYLTPAEVTYGERTLKAGTWLQAVRVLDDDLWGDVKSGKLTGFSIGGHALRTPVG